MIRSASRARRGRADDDHDAAGNECPVGRGHAAVRRQADLIISETRRSQPLDGPLRRRPLAELALHALGLCEVDVFPFD